MEGLSQVLPRVLIVSRRTVRKNKFVDFVGEYHLDLIVKYGAVPVIVPRVTGVHNLLDSFEPIHGVLLCEGENIDPNLYDSDFSSFSPDEIEEIKKAQLEDALIDRERDSIESQLASRCLERNIPYLGICRGSQLLNVACGGTLYQDVEVELGKKHGQVLCKHMDFSNYDGHRHPISVLEKTPLHDWFKGSLGSGDQLMVNSYHHQGVRQLATRFLPMAYSPDGLIEAFYAPDSYDPPGGRFIVGLQFHPERLRHEQDAVAGAVAPPQVAAPEDVYDYPECPVVYQKFVQAVRAYQRKLQSADAARRSVPLPLSPPREIPEGASNGQAVEAEEEYDEREGTVRGAKPACSGVAKGAVVVSGRRRGGAGGGGGVEVVVEGEGEGKTAAEAAEEAGGDVVVAVSEEIEQQRLELVHSFEIAKNIYKEQRRGSSLHNETAAAEALARVRSQSQQAQQELRKGAEFLKGNTPLGSLQVRRLKQVGATVRNSSAFLEAVTSFNAQKDTTRHSLSKMTARELQDVLQYHLAMVSLAEEALKERQHDSALPVVSEPAQLV